MIVIGGSASTDLAVKVAKQLGQEPARIEIKRYPDGQRHRLVDLAKVIKIPAQNVSAMTLLGRYARENLRPKRPIVVGPDEEAEQWAGTVAKELDAEHTAFTKRRVRKEGETKSRL